MELLTNEQIETLLKTVDNTELTIQVLAKKYLLSMETRVRENGTYFVCLKDDRPEELFELVREAHSEFLPDDYKFKFVQEALQKIAESHDDELEELPHAVESSIYTHELLAWLSSNVIRLAYCDQYRDEIGNSKNVVTDISGGQFMEKREVMGIVLNRLSEIVMKVNDNKGERE